MTKEEIFYKNVMKIVDYWLFTETHKVYGGNLCTKYYVAFSNGFNSIDVSKTEITKEEYECLLKELEK